MTYQRFAERIASALEWEIDKRIRASFGDPCDFRDHTCGECAWAILYNGGTLGNPQVDKYFMCRRTGWQRQNEESLSTIAACPAYVPREKEKSDGKA